MADSQLHLISRIKLIGGDNVNASLLTPNTSDKQTFISEVLSDWTTYNISVTKFLPLERDIVAKRCLLNEFLLESQDSSSKNLLLACSNR